MASPREVAEWMVGELDKQRELYQPDVAADIESKVGSEFVYFNREGGISIDRRVLRAFRKLTEDTVVWHRRERLWRKRGPHDPPGRLQVD